MDEDFCRTPQINDPRQEKMGLLPMRKQAQISCAVTAQLISTFVFATRKEQFLFVLNPKFQAFSLFLRMYSLVCVRPGRKPEYRFSRVAAQMSKTHSLFKIGTKMAFLNNLFGFTKDHANDCS